MKKDDLLSISPLDGRYSNLCKDISLIFSEYNLIKQRVRVEIEWFKFLAEANDVSTLPPISKKNESILNQIVSDFSLKDAKKIKDIELKTNHDVKAVEYYIKDKIKNTPMAKYSEYVHFCCTSEDINNVAYALMMSEAIKHIDFKISEITDNLKKNVKKYSAKAMLAYTHGQPATPTTMGKEFLIFYSRINELREQLLKIDIKCKMNGATGNYSAHDLCFPRINWPNFTKKFIRRLKLKQNRFTTQIESHDHIAEICMKISHINSVMIGLTQDIWTYISKNYFIQKNIKGEIGSSTMPHKINPINFENAEGNLGLANSIFNYLSSKLVISRMQRDLSDSTVLRNIGVGFGYSVVAYINIIKGIKKISLNEIKMKEDLENSWEILAEPIQMIARKYNIPNSYELLKDASRGKKISKTELHNIISKLNIPEHEKDKLFGLTPTKYIGLSSKLCNG